MVYIKILELCQRNKVSFAGLEKSLGFGHGAIRKWKKTSPSVEKVQKVADYFHISIDELLGRQEYLYSNETRMLAQQIENLSKDKQDLVKCYIGALRV